MSKLEDLQRRKAALRAKEPGNGSPQARAPVAFAREEPAVGRDDVDDQALTGEIRTTEFRTAEASVPAPVPTPVIAVKPVVRRRSPDDTMTTKEVDLTETARAMRDAPSVEMPVLSVPATSSEPVAPRIPAVVARPAPVSEPVAKTGSEEAPSSKPEPKRDLVTEVLENLKPLLQSLEERLGKRVDAASADAAEVKANVSVLMEELEGTEGQDGDVVVFEEGAEGEAPVEAERKPSIQKTLAALGTNVESILTELDGTEGQNGFIVEGNESRSSILQNISSMSAVMRGLLGKDFGRLQAYVVSHEIQTRKLLVRALQDDKDYLKRVEGIAIEQEPESTRRILAAFVTPHEGAEGVAAFGVVRLSLAQDMRSSIEKLDDPSQMDKKENRDLREKVDTITPKVVARAKDCLKQINWVECEKANRELIFGGDR